MQFCSGFKNVSQKMKSTASMTSQNECLQPFSFGEDISKKCIIYLQDSDKAESPEWNIFIELLNLKYKA